MIVQLSERVQALAKQKREMEKFRNQMQDLNMTLAEIQTLVTEATILKGRYNLIYSRLPEAHISDVKARVQEQVSQVKNSKQDFSMNRRQTVALRNITGNIRGLNASLEASWKLATEALLMPYYELYNLIRQLPDFRAKEVELGSMKSRLDYIKNNLPKNMNEMGEFDQLIEKFKLGLTSIQGLTPTIQAFLAKVVNHTATIGDLNEDIIAWCQLAGRAHVFQIQFRN